MAQYGPLPSNEHVPDWTLGHWRRPEYNTPDRRRSLVRLIDAAERLNLKPNTLGMLKLRHPDTFPALVVATGSSRWFVWDEIARFAAGFGHGDPALVAAVETERLERAIAECAAEVDQLAAERQERGPDADLDRRLRNRRGSLRRWRRLLAAHQAETDQ